jgi:4-amino-4-deoxychorismate lyase
MMILVDGEPAAVIPADDRGFAYGDGVFRTLAMRHGVPEMWSRQIAKLTTDCRALDLALPSESALREDVRRIAAGMPDCAVRITITRGSGGRGYVMPEPAHSRRVVAASVLPEYPVTYSQQGVQARFCTLRLAAQPRLAGIKHLNRLENVLARAEWHDPAIAEGLMLDTSGNVIAGTRSNIFITENGALVTPDLSACGVAGVTRDLVLESAARHGVDCRVEPVSRARLEAANEVLLLNSLIGVWPIAVLGQYTWSDFVLTPLVRKWLHALRNPSN